MGGGLQTLQHVAERMPASVNKLKTPKHQKCLSVELEASFFLRKIVFFTGQTKKHWPSRDFARKRGQEALKLALGQWLLGSWSFTCLFCTFFPQVLYSHLLIPRSNVTFFYNIWAFHEFRCWSAELKRKSSCTVSGPLEILCFCHVFVTEWQKTMIVSIIVTYCYHYIIITISHYCYHHIYDKNVFCYTCEEK